MNEYDSHQTSTSCELEWSVWVSLEGIGRNGYVADRSGLYLIQSAETSRVLYIGQTGRSLRGRLGSLRGVYGEEMPYNDPHAAGPALWAHRIESGESFEVSVAVLEVDRADRMGREALELTKQRIIDGCSPAYNFGRMPRGWVKSSGNNRRLVEAGKRFHRAAQRLRTGVSLGSTSVGPDLSWRACSRSRCRVTRPVTRPATRPVTPPATRLVTRPVQDRTAGRGAAAAAR